MRERFAALARDIGDGREPEAVADGFLAIAVAKMAEAIKTISVARGYDVTRYALNCFGGAGGQHACDVADALAISTVLIHPFSSLLSAYGMGLADIAAQRAQGVDEPLRIDALVRVAAIADRLSARGGRRGRRAGGRAGGDQGPSPRAAALFGLRYDDRGSALDAGGDAARVRERPQKPLRLHRSEQGDRHRGGVGRGRRRRGAACRADPPDAIDRAVRSRPRDALLFAWGLARGECLFARGACTSARAVDGPALIIEPHQTIVVEQGWRAEITAKNHVVMTRVEPMARREAIGAKADPVMLEIFNHLFMSIAEQMGVTLQNTAYSVNIKERLDFSCAVFDREGRLIANAPHMPVHLGSMDRSVESIIRDNQGRIRPGDVFALNAPYNGGTHLPDITVCTPVFDERGETILFWTASRGHHADIGGTAPGSMSPLATSIHEEGVYIDNFLLVDRGRFRERELYALLEERALSGAQSAAERQRPQGADRRQRKGRAGTQAHGRDVFA